MKKTVIYPLFCLIAILGLSRMAFAHAHLRSSLPQANATVPGPDVSIDLKFDSRVDSTRSHLDLVMPDGKTKSLSASAPGDAELAAHTTLAPGKYIIRWQALSTDGHITRGEIPFSVR
ncbi:MAG: copper resistance CopC family protein [Silvibacterium sp.]